MYIYITILLLCIPASFTKTAGCFYEDFMDGEDGVISQLCSDFTDDPWQFETYEGANINQPSFSTAKGFIQAGGSEQQCVTNNFPLSMKAGSELFIAYRATGDAVLSVELIDFYTSKTVDFIIMDLIYDEWSLDSFTIMDKGDFTFKIIAFTPEGSSLIIDSVTHVDSRDDIDSCIFDDGDDYDFDIVEEPSMVLAVDKVEPEANDAQEVADSLQDERYPDLTDGAGADVVGPRVEADSVSKEQMFGMKVGNESVEYVADRLREMNGEAPDSSNKIEDKNAGPENVNKEDENRTEDRNGGNTEEKDIIKDASDQTREEVGYPDEVNDDIDESKRDDDIKEDIRQPEYNKNSNQAHVDSAEDGNSVVEELNEKSQSGVQQSNESPEDKEAQEEYEDSVDAEEENNDNKYNLRSSKNGNDISKEENDSPENALDTLIDVVNRDETVEFEEILEDIADSIQDDKGSSGHDNDVSEQSNGIPKDDIQKGADRVADDNEYAQDDSHANDTDNREEAIEDVRKIWEDEVKDIEVGTSESRGANSYKEEIVADNLDGGDISDSSQPFSERMPAAAEWVTLLTVLGVILSIACLLVLSAVLLIAGRRRTKKFKDYPYYHYEIPQGAQKSKNDTFPNYSVP